MRAHLPADPRPSLFHPIHPDQEALLCRVGWADGRMGGWVHRGEGLWEGVREGCAIPYPCHPISDARAPQCPTVQAMIHVVKIVIFSVQSTYYLGPSLARFEWGNPPRSYLMRMQSVFPDFTRCESRSALEKAQMESNRERQR